MANVLDIRRRIRSVRNTRQITKAMKMISAARLRRAQERALGARPYGQMLTNILKSLVSRAEIYDPETGEPRHPLLARRPEKRILLIVVTGDRGLAAAFNANITKAALRFLREKQGSSIDVVAVGRKGRDFFRRRYPWNPDPLMRLGPVQLVAEHVGVLGKLQFSDAGRLAESLIAQYTEEKIDAVYVLYNEFKSVIAQRLVVERVLPIGELGAHEFAQAEEMTREERERAARVATSAAISTQEADTAAMDEHAAQFGVASQDYIYEQPPQELFRDLLPKYVAIQVFRAMLESVAAEHAARMTAMDSATSNASDMIDALTLTMNRARQAAITKEIIEIVSGAAAL
ncbi:MAG: ATP synthase F1 subunit gamma [Acidobacteria bacterium]|nr:ATP synthase F1 subunit gamma [Acidobacteriota bacterium]